MIWCSRYWDVTQNIIRLPVGGETQSGKMLKEFLHYQIALEDAIPKVRSLISDQILLTRPALQRSSRG